MVGHIPAAVARQNPLGRHPPAQKSGLSRTLFPLDHLLCRTTAYRSCLRPACISDAASQNWFRPQPACLPAAWPRVSAWFIWNPGWPENPSQVGYCPISPAISVTAGCSFRACIPAPWFRCNWLDTRTAGQEAGVGHQQAASRLRVLPAGCSGGDLQVDADPLHRRYHRISAYLTMTVSAKSLPMF